MADPELMAALRRAPRRSVEVYEWAAAEELLATRRRAFETMRQGGWRAWTSRPVCSARPWSSAIWKSRSGGWPERRRSGPRASDRVRLPSPGDGRPTADDSLPGSDRRQRATRRALRCHAPSSAIRRPVRSPSASGSAAPSREPLRPSPPPTARPSCRDKGERSACLDTSSVGRSVLLFHVSRSPSAERCPRWSTGSARRPIGMLWGGFLFARKARSTGNPRGTTRR